MKDRFKKDTPQYSNSFTVTIPNLTNSSIEISKYAKIALDKIFIPGIKFRKAGVITGTFVPENERMTSLFEEDLQERHTPLMMAMDSLNKKLGTQKVKLASMDIQKTWKMDQKHISPKYSTSFQESIILKA